MTLNSNAPPPSNSVQLFTHNQNRNCLSYSTPESRLKMLVREIVYLYVCMIFYIFFYSGNKLFLLYIILLPKINNQQGGGGVFEVA